uniref:ATPase AAA-type core domain-containing protein n=1 Tax=viral metagenome TaxID=1070528 RepID=A0A6C0E0U3_9ZZZZ
MSHKYNTRLTSGAIKRTKYISHDSNFDDNSSSEDDSASIASSSSSIKSKFNKLDYYKFLNSLYPSKYSATKVTNEIANVNKVKPKCVKDDTNFKNFILRNKMFLEAKNPKNSLHKIIDKNNRPKNILRPKNNSKNIIIINIKENGKYEEEDKEYEYEYEDDEDEHEDEDDEDEDEDEDKEADEDDEDEESNNKSKNDKVNQYNTNENSVPALPHIANKNYKVFNKILCDEDKEADYFKKCLSKTQQETLIDKLKELQDLTKIDKPYLLHLVDLDIPDEYKACALRKINTMRSMDGGFGNSEFYKIKSWVDAFLKIPFNKYNNLPISFADGIEKCHDFMEYTKKTLDGVVYGLEDAKIQIMQMVGLWLVNPNAIGCAIAIKGPPGTGKTTLIKEGISKILNRPFALVALGGCGDSGFLDGFDYTYEGSKYGKIIDILIQCGCMNPVILFDELDKLSDSFKGQEVTGVLTHLTDSTQNTKFSDKYFSEISINVSKALFIFSYNDENAVNNVLKDRMYKIETKGYKTKEKLIIAKEHLLPKIRDEIKFDISTIVFNDDLLEYIINDFTEKEDGVRNLKRCLEIIYKKLNLYRLMKPNINLFENSEGLKLKNKISFPCILTKQMIDDLINKGTTKDIPYGMYV